MSVVTISSKFQVAIPLSIRRALRLKPGQKLAVIQYVDRIELVPILPMRKARGFLRGIETSVERGLDDE